MSLLKGKKIWKVQLEQRTAHIYTNVIIVNILCSSSNGIHTNICLNGSKIFEKSFGKCLNVIMRIQSQLIFNGKLSCYEFILRR